jgi:hypothetical protein
MIQAAAGYNHMDMVMWKKILPPGMQDRYNSGNSTEEMPVFGQINDRLGRAGKQLAQKKLLIQPNQGIQIMRHRQNHMVIRNLRDYLVFPLRDPSLLGRPLAARAVPVVAGRVMQLDATIRTEGRVKSQLFSFAHGDQQSRTFLRIR